MIKTTLARALSLVRRGPRRGEWQRRAACLTILFLLSAPAAPAEERRGASGLDTPPAPGWIPRYVQLQGTKWLGWLPVTAADTAAATKRLLAVEELLKKTPVIQQHRGFEVQAHLTWAQIGSVIDRQGLLSYEITLYVFVPSKAVVGETDTWIEITFNPYPQDFTNSILTPSEKEWDIFREQQISPPVHGFQAYVPQELDGVKRVLLTAGGRAPWRQVTMEEYLRWEIRREGELEAEHAAMYATEIAQASSGTPYERWVAEAPARRKEREEILASIAAADPAQAATARAELEKSEREITEQLKATNDRDRHQSQVDAQATTLLETERKRLASLTPAERTKPAWTTPTGGLFAAPTEPDAQRLVQPDAAFFRKGPGLASNVRAITLDFVGTGYGREVVTTIMNELDWDALAAMLEEPPK